jgi:hypothetical protein
VELSSSIIINLEKEDIWEVGLCVGLKSHSNLPYNRKKITNKEGKGGSTDQDY